jgi:hypothetical protein
MGINMSLYKRKQYYKSMMNILYGLQDDFDSNDVCEEAKGLLTQLVEICKEDYFLKFND